MSDIKYTAVGVTSNVLSLGDTGLALDFSDLELAQEIQAGLADGSITLLEPILEVENEGTEDEDYFFGYELIDGAYTELTTEPFAVVASEVDEPAGEEVKATGDGETAAAS